MHRLRWGPIRCCASSPNNRSISDGASQCLQSSNQFRLSEISPVCKLPRILCYQCIAHNPQHTQQFAVIDVWFQGWCAPFLPIHLHTTITETACSLSLCLVPSCLMVAHACDMSAWVAHKGWSRGVIETCVCNHEVAQAAKRWEQKLPLKED
jgi:hypothetical protein